MTRRMILVFGMLRVYMVRFSFYNIKSTSSTESESICAEQKLLKWLGVTVSVPWDWKLSIRVLAKIIESLESKDREVETAKNNLSSGVSRSHIDPLRPVIPLSLYLASKRLKKLHYRLSVSLRRHVVVLAPRRRL